jgi:hypothetical protein
MKLFLDDIREPKDCTSYMYRRIGHMNPIYLEDWFVVRNYTEFVDAVSKHINEITHVSFDHDLSDEHYDPTMFEGQDKYNQLYDNFVEKTGYDCAKWMKMFYDENNVDYPIMFVHSMNPTGAKNIINVFI